MSEMTPEELSEVVDQLSGDQNFNDRNTEWQQNRLLVNRQRAVVIPGTTLETEWRTPEPMDAADKYTARFLGAPFTVEVSARGTGPVAEKKAQQMENYDQRLLSRWWDQKAFHGAIHDMAGVTGEGYVHLTINRAVLPIIPQQEDGEDPEAYLERAKPIMDEFESGERADLIVLEPVREAESIRYTPDRKVMMASLKVPLAPLMKQYGAEGAGGYWGKKGKSKGFQKASGLIEVTSIDGAVDVQSITQGMHAETIELYIVEDDEYIYHMVRTGGQQAKGQKYEGIGCYKNLFGAPGFIPIFGRQTNSAEYRYAVHPLTHGLFAVAPLINITGSIVYSGGILGEMQRVTLEPMPGPEAAAERRDNKNLEIELIGNRVVKFPDGYKAVQPNIGVNADTLESLNRLEILQDKYSYPKEIGTPSDSDASSGYQAAVQRDIANNLIDPALGNIAQAMNTILTLKDNAIKELGIDVKFRNFAPSDDYQAGRQVMTEITIKADDIVEVDRSVSFDSLSQFSRQSKIAIGQELLAQELISREMFYSEFMGISDPQRLQRRMLMEKAQTIADEFALKAASALMGKVSQYVAAEATVDSGLAPYLAPSGAAGGGQVTDPMSQGAYVNNGAGGAMPVHPPVPNAAAEMGTPGGSYGG